MKITYSDALPVGLSKSEKAHGLEKLLPAFEYRNPQLFARVRLAAAVWVLILAAILYGYDRGGWWRPLLILAAAAHLYYAHRLRAIGARNKSRETE